MNFLPFVKRALKLVLAVHVAGSTFLASQSFADTERVSFCHLQKKVDPTLQFNDGIVVEVSKSACQAHCQHGDHPMPVPLNNNSHPNRQCARIHVVNGLPECEVNTPSTVGCSPEACLERCENT